MIQKILIGILILALLYGTLRLGEHLTTQELTRAANSQTDETACLMWKPRFIKGGGLCYVNLLNAKGKVVDTAKVQILDTAFNALQQYGQMDFQGPNLTLTSRQSGEVVQRFVVRDGRLGHQD